MYVDLCFLGKVSGKSDEVAKICVQKSSDNGLGSNPSLIKLTGRPKERRFHGTERDSHVGWRKIEL